MVEIRPRIFIEKFTAYYILYSMPKGYEEYPPEMVRKVADRSYLATDVDVISHILHEYCCNCLLNGVLRFDEGVKAEKEYKDYTGEDWVSPGFFHKRD